MGTRDEEKALLTKPVELPGGDNYRRGRNFRRRRSIAVPWKKIGKVSGTLAILLLIGFAGFKLYSGRNNSSVPAADNAKPAQQDTEAQENTEDVPDAELSENFMSDTLRIELQYPKTWQAKETDDGLRVESAEFNYQSQNGPQSGVFRIYIRKGARAVDSKYIGRGIAIKPSEKLVYSSPAVGQRTDTLITPFGLDKPDHFAFFLIAGNFQLKPGDTLGPNYGKEVDTFIIAGGYTSPELKEDLATNPMAGEDYADKNAYKQALEIIKSLKIK